MLARLVLPAREPADDAGPGTPEAHPRALGSVAALLRAAAARPALLLSMTAGGLLALSAGTNNTIMVMFLDRDLGGHAADVGWLSAANGLAQIVAGGAVIAVASRLPPGRSIAATTAAMAVCSAVLATASTVPVAIGAVIGVALANAPFNMSSTTVEQTYVEERMVAQLIAMSAGLTSGLFLAGSVGGAWLADHTSARTGMLMSAGCLGAAALVTAPLWRRTPLTPPAAPALVSHSE